MGQGNGLSRKHQEQAQRLRQAKVPGLQGCRFLSALDIDTHHPRKCKWPHFIKTVNRGSSVEPDPRLGCSSIISSRCLPSDVCHVGHHAGWWHSLQRGCREKSRLHHFSGSPLSLLGSLRVLTHSRQSTALSHALGYKRGLVKKRAAHAGSQDWG